MLIGITGPTGSGKSAVSKYFARKGYPVIDADQISREVTQPGLDCLTELFAEFGNEIIHADGTLNRSKLGKIVFGSDNKRLRLQQIIFPYIEKRVMELVGIYSKQSDFVFLDAPTLLESNLKKECYKIVVVTALPHIRRKRIMQRDGLTVNQADLRLGAQQSDKFYTASGDYEISNNGSIEDLNTQSEEILDKLIRLKDKQ